MRFGASSATSAFERANKATTITLESKKAGTFVEGIVLRFLQRNGEICFGEQQWFWWRVKEAFEGVAMIK